MICAINGSIYLSSWTASAERSREEEETAENMEASDGLLLQVNNGEQWCNRWKHPGEDLVSNWLLSPHRNLCCCCCFYPVSCRKGCIKCLCVPLNLAVVVCAGPQHQPLGPALRCQHLEGRPAEQKEALCGSLLSLLYTTELGNATLQLINSLMGSVDWDPLRSRRYLVIYFSKLLS